MPISNTELDNLTYSWSKHIYQYPRLSPLQIADFYLETLEFIKNSADLSETQKGNATNYLFTITAQNANFETPELSQFMIGLLDDSIARYPFDMSNFSDLALRNIHPEILFKLFEQPNLRIKIENFPDRDKLIKRMLGNHLMYNFLDSADQSVDARSQQVLDVLQWFIKTPLEDYRNSNGQTIMHICAFESYSDKLGIYMLEKFPQLINVTDKHGNSVFYYIITESNGFYDTDSYVQAKVYICDAEMREAYQYFVAKGAKCIRNFQEEKSALHIKVALNLPLELDPTTDINSVDLEHARTALHYAVILQNYEAAAELLAHGASPLIADNSGRTPLSYACLYGAKDLVIEMMKSVEPSALQLADSSYLTDVCFSGNKDLYAWAVQNMPADSASDKIMLMQIDNGELRPDTMESLSDEQKIIIASAFAKMVPQANSTAIDYVRNNVLPELTKVPATLPPGRAYGVELEISDLPCVPALPMNLLKEWFGIREITDRSVNNPIFTPYSICIHKQEYVSGILASASDVKGFLQFAKYLYSSGAKVAKSTGKHVHINIRGDQNSLPSITASMDLKNYTVNDIELAVVKQIITNWSELEPLLQVILRQGELIGVDENPEHYAEPIRKNLANYMNATSLEEIAFAAEDRYCALNVQSLLNSQSVNVTLPNNVTISQYEVYKGHGTLEVRLHEGAIHPTLIEAWLNFVHRLVSISIKQVQDQIDTGKTFEFTAFNKLKDLIHILLAERDYAQTWDKTLKIPAGSATTFSELEASIHDEIAVAPMYDFYRAAKTNNVTLQITGEAPIWARPYEQGNVADWLALSQEFPGILAETYVEPYNNSAKATFENALNITNNNTIEVKSSFAPNNITENFTITYENLPNSAQEQMPYLGVNILPESSMRSRVTSALPEIPDRAPINNALPEFTSSASSIYDFLLSMPVLALAFIISTFILCKLSARAQPFFSYDRYRRNSNDQLDHLDLPDGAMDDQTRSEQRPSF
jgi:ankyrin repeat protein